MNLIIQDIGNKKITVYIDNKVITYPAGDYEYMVAEEENSYRIYWYSSRTIVYSLFPINSFSYIYLCGDVTHNLYEKKKIKKRDDDKRYM